MADETGEIAQLHRLRRTSCAEKNSRKNKIRREWGVSHQPANDGTLSEFSSVWVIKNSSGATN